MQSNFIAAILYQQFRISLPRESRLKYLSKNCLSSELNLTKATQSYFPVSGPTSDLKMTRLFMWLFSCCLFACLFFVLF